MQFRKTIITGATFGALALASTSALSATLNFDQTAANVASGSISFDSGSNTLSGSNIGYGAINVLDAPNGNANGDYGCPDCTVGFTATNLQSVVDNTVNFDEGSITISGKGETVSGTLNSASISGSDLTDPNGSLTVSLNGESGELADEIFNKYLGTNADNATITSTNITTDGYTDEGDGVFSSDLDTADLTASSQPVPAPSELTLFGLGLALIGGALGFRKKGQF